jgi:hypothetical protein
MLNNIAWVHNTPLLPSGIIIGCDEKQEWILPWWWKNYSTHNTLPVLFVDFGLSNEAMEWCEQRGKLVSLPSQIPSIKTKNQIENSTIEQWESAYGNGFWKGRSSWFKKPFALLHTPFERTLWLDVDCEVKANLQPLFSEKVKQISLAPEPEYAQAHMQAFSIKATEETIYNSGVILFPHGTTVILDWAQACIERSDAFWSDQHLLSRLLHEKQIQVDELSQLYNWHMALGKNEQAQIIHWLGDPGKEYICLNLHGFL